MTKLQQKAQAQVKQMVGQMIGDDRLAQEGRQQLQNTNQNVEAQPKNDDDSANSDGSATRERRCEPAKRRGPLPE